MHRLTDAEWRPTPYTFGTINPTGIVVHGTVSGLAKYSCVNYLLNSRYNRVKKRRHAYHVIIEIDGTVVQLADLNKRLRHAGRSSFRGKKWCNSYTIGVALVNPGYMTGTIELATDIYGYKHTNNLMKAESPLHPNGKIWMQPTKEQQRSLALVVKEIKEMFPIEFVAGHYHVSPFRKNDPPPPDVIDLTEIETLGGLEDVGESLGAALAEAERELYHTTDVRANSCTPQKVLSKESREYKTAAAIKHTGGVTAVGVGTLEAFRHSNVAAAKSYIDLISSFVSSYGILIVGGLGVAALLAGALLQLWKEESYEEGRYEPSGEANDPD